MVRRKPQKPQRIGDVLAAVVQQAAQRYATVSMLQRRWSRLVGKPLAAHTKPMSLRRGQLVVHTDQPGASFALSYERARLMERLQQATKGKVKELVIRPGEL